MSKVNRNPLNGWIVASVPQPERYNSGWFPPIKWCEERFKEQNWRYVSEGVFEFRRHDDHLVFLLKWS